MPERKKNWYSMRTMMEAEGEYATEIDIYGDICGDSWWSRESDWSANRLSKELANLPENVKRITVAINSYGGEVAEGLAIYNALVRHPAHVTTVVDGFACSIASVIAMAGDERIMSPASLMMIHNAWSYASGDGAALRKQADDLDTITGASKAAYLSRISIDEDELSAMMDAETWLTPEQALAMGFATEVSGTVANGTAQQAARREVFSRLVASMAAQEPEPDPDEDPDEDPEPEPDDEPDEEPDEDPEPGQKAAARWNIPGAFFANFDN